MATVDVYGYVVYMRLHLNISVAYVLYNCVGFCVARSDDVGNAKASSCGMSDWYGLPRFLFIIIGSLGES